MTPGAPGLAARRARPVDIPPPARVQALFDTPIFAPDRRPVARAGSGASQGSPMAGYAVGGVAVDPGGAVAVVSLPGNSTQLVHVGDHVGDWRVAAIARARVAFERQGRRHDLIVGAPAAPVITPDAQAQEGANPQ